MRYYSTTPFTCLVPNCDTGRKHKGHGLCQIHYGEWRHHGKVAESEWGIAVATIRTCSREDCDKPATVRGWCHTHYERWRRTGSDDLVRATTEERFWPCVEKDGPIPIHNPALGKCWTWLASHSTGYGMFYLNDRKTQAHRVAYEICVGEIPKGYFIDHLCWNKGCVNPAHLDAVTPKENSQRSVMRFQLCLDLFVEASTQVTYWRDQYQRLAEKINE